MDLWLRARRLFAALALLLALAFFALAPVAVAQHSGGSFGGSHFGSGGGGGGGHGSFGGSHGGFGGGTLGSHGHWVGHGGPDSVDGTGYRHGSGDIRGPLIVLMCIVALAVVFSIFAGRASELPGPEARAWMYIDVTAVRIAVDGTARAFIQDELAKLARRPTQSRAALLSSLRRVVHLLRKCDAAWIYGGASNFRPMSAPVGEAAFRRLANDARSKFQHELVRHADGKLVEGAGPKFSARSRDGEGVALITIVVAAKREIVDFDGGTRADIVRVLDDLDALTAGALVALEIAWSPADPEDRISTATLEAIHPELKKLPGALGGRIDCGSCRGPFAAELPTCPHCGAPSPTTSTVTAPAPEE